MSKIFKIAAVAAAVLATTPAFAAPVAPSNGNPSATARIVRPLTFSVTGTLDFGTIVLNGVTGAQNINLAANGALTCDAQLICAQTGLVPTYNVRGTQGQTVNIIKTATTLNGSNGGSLQLTPVGAASVVLPNSGAPGIDFNIGGSLVVDETTADGVYTGFVDVQVDYN